MAGLSAHGHRAHALRRGQSRRLREASGAARRGARRDAGAMRHRGQARPRHPLHVTSFDQSSSILPLPSPPRLLPPHQVETQAIEVAGMTLDDLPGRRRGLAPERFNLLTIDIQGAEP